MVVLLFGGLGLVREPRDPVPADFSRYIADIEKEFQGVGPEKVLMDTGTWIYLREKVLMKDRSAPISVHLGMNRRELDHDVLVETIRRIESRGYEKILAREVETPNSWYDFDDRGSGVRDALLRNYREVRRIPGVRGIQHWWPRHLVAEVSVLVPRAR
jgi:hypothetical protein